MAPASATPAAYRRIEITGPGVPALVTAEVIGPRPGQGWALIAPRAVGICRSDLKELLGIRQGRRDFGHELVATVLERSDAGELAVGDQVVLDPHVTVTRTSGFAELVEFHGPADALQRALPRLPATLDPGSAVFVEPLACAVRCVRRVRQAGSEIGHRPGPVAVVGAGVFGVLIAALLRAAGQDVALVNRSPARLDRLREAGALPASALLTFDAAAGRRFGTLVLATTFAEPDLVLWCAEHAGEDGLITVFGGTAAGMSVGDDGLDLDALRRDEELRACRFGGQGRWLAGCHGAESRDFTSAMRALERDLVVARAVAALRGPELSLRQAVDALPEYARAPVLGKPIVHLQQAARR